MAEFMTKEQLNNLKQHKYVSEGKSFLEKYVLNHLWDFLLEYIPMSVAPNVITLVGMPFIVIPFIGMMLTNPDGKSGGTFWHIAMAIGIFIFQTLDNLDGRQARRTNSSNPLGEFFDHGLDAISDPFTLMAVIMSLGIGTNLDLFFVMGLIIVQDYSFYWRAHWTDKYVFGDVDICEFQIIIIVVLVITGLSQTVLTTLLFNVIELRTFFIWLYFFLTLYYLGDVWLEALKICFFKKMEPEKRAIILAPVYPLSINVLLAVGARFFTGGLYEQYPVAFLTVYIICTGKLSCRLLVSNMTKSKMAFFDSSMVAFGFLFLTAKQSVIMIPTFMQMSPIAGLFIALAFATIDYTKYMINICQQMADTFNVNCLSLEPPKKED